MDDVIEAVAKNLRGEYRDALPVGSVSRVAVKGLLDAGFRVFRPDDCDTVTRCVAHNHDGPVNWKWSECDVRTMALVPVEETPRPLNSAP